MNIFHVLMPLLFLFSFQDTTKNVRSSDQDVSVTVADIDSSGLGLDTAFAGCLYRKAKVLIDSGEYDLAFGKLDSSEQIYLSAMGQVDTLIANLYHLLGVTFRKNGRLQRSLLANQKALDIRLEILKERHPDVASSYNNHGLVYEIKGDFKQAILFHEKALAIRREFLGQKHSSVASSYNNIGIIWIKKGEYDKAIYYFDMALNIKAEALGEEHISVAGSYNNLGLVWKKKGDYDLAIFYFKKALDIKLASLGHNHPSVGNTYNNLGNVWKSKGEYDKAILYHENALGVRIKSFGHNHSSVAASYFNLGNVWNNKGEYDKAIFYFESALKIDRESIGHNHSSVAASYFNLGNVWNSKGEYDKANLYFNKASNAIGYNNKVANRFGKVIDLFVLQEYLLLKNAYYFAMCEDMGNLIYRDSIAFNYEELVSLTGYILKESSSKSIKQFHSSKSFPVYEQAIDYFLDRNLKGEIPKTFRFAEKLKSRHLSEKMKVESFITSFGIPDSLSDKEYNIGVDMAYFEKKRFQEKYERKLANDSLVRVYENKLFKLRRRRDKLLELLKSEYSNYFNARYSQRVISVSGVQDSILQPNQALLEYFVGDSSVFTFTILPDTFFVHQIIKDFPLDTWVEDMLHGIYDPYTPGLDTLDREFSFQQAASLIYHKVFHHVDTLLPEGTDIILVPDGILGYIPFDALLTDSTDSESYLIRDHQISYAYSATLQAEMENMQHDHQAQKKILAFAPSFDHFETTGDTDALASRFIDVSNTRNWLGPLKYNDDEVMTISQMVPTDVFMDSTATKDQFLQHASDYSIIHLSTHGKANDKMGDYSFLAFYDPQDSSETWLYNRELYGLDLNADMVVLSACETGIGELQRGEGIISLARGFSYAGAKSIITTLWSVNDRSTQKVMELFYGNLAEGMSKDAALRQAKLDYLDQYPHLGKSPYFWAGIIPIGDMSPIEFSTECPLWIMPIFLVMIFVFFVLYFRVRPVAS